MASIGKVGRNDPCPCGSGRKYKHCCGASRSGTVIDATAAFAANRSLSEMNSHFAQYHSDPRKETMTLQETLGKPNAATGVTRELRSFLEGQDFKTDADMDRAIAHFREDYNTRGLDDFLGLSPEQMLSMSQPPIDNFQRWIEVGSGVRAEDVLTVPILRQALFLLTRLELEGGFKLTQSGYLPPAFAKEWFDFCFLNEDPKLKACIKVRGESDYLPMSQIVAVCEEAGLAEGLSGGRFAITTEGRRLLCAQDYPALYRELFFGYLDGLLSPDWPGAERLPPLARNLPLFFCNVLRVIGDKPIMREDLEGILGRAFKSLAEDALYRSLIAISGCTVPAQELGLIEVQSMEIAEEKPIQRTEFYSRAISWK